MSKKKKQKTTIATLKKEIRKKERKLMRYYKAMMTYPDKAIRKSEAYQRYSELFKKTRSAIRPKNGISKMTKKELQNYLNILTGVESMRGSTVKEFAIEKAMAKRRAKEKGATDDLIKFIDKNLDKFEQFVNTKTFAESVSLYEYESDLWDQLRFAKEEEKSNIFKLWLEDKEDEFEIERIEDKKWLLEHRNEIIKKEGEKAYQDKLDALDQDVIHYSEYVEDDNWKEILDRLSKEW